MEKLKITIHKPEQITSNLVRLTDEAVAKIKEIQRMTGISARQFVSELILHYADEVEFMEK